MGGRLPQFPQGRGTDRKEPGIEGADRRNLGRLLVPKGPRHEKTGLTSNPTRGSEEKGGTWSLPPQKPLVPLAPPLGGFRCRTSCPLWPFPRNIQSEVICSLLPISFLFCFGNPRKILFLTDRQSMFVLRQTCTIHAFPSFLTRHIYPLVAEICIKHLRVCVKPSWRGCRQSSSPTDTLSGCAGPPFRPGHNP